MTSSSKTLFILSLVASIACGCGKKTATTVAAKTATSPSPGPIVVPANTISGRVASVVEKSRFAVLSYGVGDEPPIGQKLNAYRNNLKVAELKVCGPQNEGSTVADIVAGDVQVDDEVRPD